MDFENFEEEANEISGNKYHKEDDVDRNKKSSDSESQESEDDSDPITSSEKLEKSTERESDKFDSYSQDENEDDIIVSDSTDKKVTFNMTANTYGEDIGNVEDEIWIRKLIPQPYKK